MNYLRPDLRVSWWFSSTKTMVLPNHRHVLNMGRGIVTEASEKLHILSLLPVRENLIEFCRCESINTYTDARYCAVNSSLRFLQTEQHITVFYFP